MIVEQVKGIKICFVLPDAYSLFDNSTNYPFGGAEVRASILSKKLATIKFQVSFITNNHNQLPFQKLYEVCVLADRYSRSPLRSPSKLYKILNFFYDAFIKIEYRYFRILKEPFEDYFKYYWLNKSRADYFFVFNMTYSSLSVVDYCIENNRTYFLFIASDEEVNIENSKLGIEKDAILKFVRNATKIVVQNTLQKDAIRNLFNKEAYVMNNPMVMDFKPTNAKKMNFVLWVGKSNVIKRPLLFIELARKNPNLEFVMVCNKDSDIIYNEILTKLPKNVTFFESKTLDEIEELFASALIYLSTSEFEGFPNTFLQAGKFATPVISTTVNPNSYITENNCGIVCEAVLNELSEALNTIYYNGDQRIIMGINHFNYVKKNHEVGKVVKEFTEFIKS